MISPKLEALSEKDPYKKLEYVKVDVDELEDLAAEQGYVACLTFPVTKHQDFDRLACVDRNMTANHAAEFVPCPHSTSSRMEKRLTSWLVPTLPLSKPSSKDCFRRRIYCIGKSISCG